MESRWEFSLERLETDIGWSMIHLQLDGGADKALANYAQSLCRGDAANAKRATSPNSPVSEPRLSRHPD